MMTRNSPFYEAGMDGCVLTKCDGKWRGRKEGRKESRKDIKTTAEFYNPTRHNCKTYTWQEMAAEKNLDIA